MVSHFSETTRAFPVIDLQSWKPRFLPSEFKTEDGIKNFCASMNVVFLHDSWISQAREYLKLQHPQRKLSENEIQHLLAEWCRDADPYAQGEWVYYPWDRRLIHILEKEKFIAVRTNRNQYKITPEEQALLETKRIGVVGLSVGQSVALTLAMERIGGHLILADYDVLELSNLNRIRCPLHQLELEKTIAVAREIAQIDPYLKITLFPQGLHEDNLDEFFESQGKLDLVVEECDGLEIKLLVREKAKSLGIPVVMDTSDRGMLDIERFDLEPTLPIFHGLAGDIQANQVKGLNNEQKIPYILKMIGSDSLSGRLKASMLEVEQSITTWPQLASSVVMGGGLAADTTRRILLNEEIPSGRFYVDPADHIGKPASPTPPKLPERPNPLSWEKAEQIHREEAAKLIPGNFTHPALPLIEHWVDMACWATSTANCQPWKWIWDGTHLTLLHDHARSFSFGDYEGMGSWMSMGAAMENLDIAAKQSGYHCHWDISNLSLQHPWVATARFTNSETPENDPLYPYIKQRLTNRNYDTEGTVTKSELEEYFKAYSPEGAQWQVLTKDDEAYQTILDITVDTDAIRLLIPQAHQEFYKEVHFNEEDAKRTGEGIDLTSLALTEGEKAGFALAGQWDGTGWLSDWNRGQGFGKVTRKLLDAAPALGILTMDQFTPRHMLLAGRIVQRAWMGMVPQQIGAQPFTSPIFFLARAHFGNGIGFHDALLPSLKQQNQSFRDALQLNPFQAPSFLFRLFRQTKPAKPSFRLPIDQVYKVLNS